MAGMHRIARIVVAGALATVALSLAATAVAGVAVYEIAVRDDEFDPASPPAASINPNQPEAIWQRGALSTGLHNVQSNDRLFRSGDPVAPMPQFSLQASAGTFKYVCEEHSTGMKGVLKLQPIVDVLSPKTAKITWATQNSTTGDRFDVQFRTKGTPKWKDWFENTRRRSATFGANDKPLKVRPQRTYQVRVRSAKGTTAAKESGYSPPLDFSTGVS